MFIINGLCWWWSLFVRFVINNIISTGPKQIIQLLFWEQIVLRFTMMDISKVDFTRWNLFRVLVNSLPTVTCQKVEAGLFFRDVLTAARTLIGRSWSKELTLKMKHKHLELGGTKLNINFKNMSINMYCKWKMNKQSHQTEPL